MSELIDNRRQRVERLKEVIRSLHAGVEPEAVKKKLSELVSETTGEEIVEMEQQLMREGMSAEEVKSMCDLHAQVTREIITDRTAIETEPGHPCDTFRRENREIRRVAAEMRQIIEELAGPEAEDPNRLAALLARWRATTESLLEVEKHYARKENLLFSYLERHGVTGPGKVMWAKDDDIRTLLKGLREALQEQKAELEEWRFVASQVAEPLIDQVEQMIDKEELILLPMSLSKLAASEWGAIYRESARFGFCLVAPGEGYTPPAEADAETEPTPGDREPIRFPSGSLTSEQLHALFQTFPFDLTFVDTDDRVAFFSEGKDRIFSRTPAVIGRKVQNCHPPASVEIVERILSDFREGRRDVAEFWIEMGMRFIHIRYFAVRDETGRYLGTLEVTQDLTPLRALQGERRLLQYDDDEDTPPRATEDEALPDWVTGGRVGETIDVDALLARGEHPLAEVRRLLRELAAGESILLTGAFRPEPLIETLSAEGFPIACRRISKTRWETYIGKG